MCSSTAGKHAGSGTASNQPAVAEPTFAERARTLVYLGRVGSLSTLSRKQQGFPFGSVMPYELDDHANPVFLISTMAARRGDIRYVGGLIVPTRPVHSDRALANASIRVLTSLASL